MESQGRSTSLPVGAPFSLMDAWKKVLIISQGNICIKLNHINVYY